MLEKLARSIEENKNILEKKQINPIVEFIEQNTYKSERIFSDIGEDSASIDNNDKLILVTTDRIKTSYITSYPFGAGFSAILVGVDDIYCCGGIPLAGSIILSYKDTKIGQQLLEGISIGSKKFKVPIIRGHTTPNGDFYELSSTIIGEVKKDNYISAKNAQIGDNIILAVDFDGKISNASKYYWDTVTFKSSQEVLGKRATLNNIAQKGLANSSKDISNGGIFGTIFQLIDYSNVGANININNFQIPPVLIENDYNLILYSKMYLTTSFVLTTSINNSDKILNMFHEKGFNASVIGNIIEEKGLIINNGKESLKINIYQKGEK